MCWGSDGEEIDVLWRHRVDRIDRHGAGRAAPSETVDAVVVKIRDGHVANRPI
jgi:hypothetical protein